MRSGRKKEGGRETSTRPRPAWRHGDVAVAFALALCGGALHLAAGLSGAGPGAIEARIASSVAWLALGLAARAATGGEGAALARPSTPGAAGWTGAACIVGFGEALRRLLPGADAVAGLEPLPTGLAFAALALLPGVGEELFFRGPALRAGVRRVGPLSAWAVSTLAFAALHPGQIAAAALLGGALGGLAIATGRTREAMAAHVAHNAFGLLHLGVGAG